MSIITNDQYTSPSAQGFIVIDGINGAGKSSLISHLASFFHAHPSIYPRFTREPGGTALGKHLRSLFIDSQERLSISPLTEVYLFAADRAQHVSELISPALHRRELIVCDRYYYSSVAFQAYGRGIDRELVLSVNQTAIQGCRPDLVLLLDLPVEDALARLAKRNLTDSSTDAFEEESFAFHQRVRSGFLALAEELPEPFYVVDARRSPHEIAEHVETILRSYLQVFM